MAQRAINHRKAKAPLLLMCFLLGGFSPLGVASVNLKDSSSRDDALSSGVNAVADSTVLLSRGSVDVTMADLKARAFEIPRSDRTMFFSSRQRLDQTLRQLLEAKQLAAEGRKFGLDQSYEYQAAMRLGTERTLASIYNQYVRDQAAAAADIEQIARERFIAAPRESSYLLQVRHILILSLGDPDQAAASAEQLRARIERGESIEALAAQYSADTSSKDSGGLIEAASDSLDPSFSSAALALDKAGDLAPVTQTQHGFHVIELVSKTPQGTASFENQKATLMGQARASVTQRALTSNHEKLFGGDLTLNEAAVGQVLANPSSVDDIPEPGQ